MFGVIERALRAMRRRDRQCTECGRPLPDDAPDRSQCCDECVTEWEFRAGW